MEDRLKRGPFTVDELKQRGITPHTAVMRMDSSVWQEAGSIPELTELFCSSLLKEPQRQQSQYNGGQDIANQSNTGKTAYNRFGNGMNMVIPSDYKVLSILMIVFGVLTCCCWFDIPFVVFGILALNAGNMVGTYYSVGDYANAQKKSDEAKKMLLWGLGTGVAWVLVSVIISVLMFSSDAYQEMLESYMDVLNDMQ